MERYYKTIRDSKTGLKIKALIDKADEFDKQVAVLREKYGFSKTWTSSFYYRSLDIVEFTEEPDMANWKRMKDVHNGYYPRARCKNKEILQDFTDINKMFLIMLDLILLFLIFMFSLWKVIGNVNYLKIARR